MNAWRRRRCPRPGNSALPSLRSWRISRAHSAILAISPASCCLDRGDVDLLHRHHCFEDTLSLSATGCKGIGQRAWGNLPGQTPTVLTPTAGALLPSMADNRVPVAVRFGLIVRRDLERERLTVPECGATVETKTGDAEDCKLHGEGI